MSGLSEQVGRQLRAFREREGEFVTFDGHEYRCFVEEISGAKAGEQAVPRGTYGVFVAMSNPLIFDFSPEDFAPWTAIIAPMEGDELIRNGQVYCVTNYDFEQVDRDTNGFLCFGLRKIWQDVPIA